MMLLFSTLSAYVYINSIISHNEKVYPYTLHTSLKEEGLCLDIRTYAHLIVNFSYDSKCFEVMS